MRAARLGRDDCITALLQCEADPFIRNRNHLTAFDVAGQYVFCDAGRGVVGVLLTHLLVLHRYKNRRSPVLRTSIRKVTLKRGLNFSGALTTQLCPLTPCYLRPSAHDRS